MAGLREMAINSINEFLPLLCRGRCKRGSIATDNIFFNPTNRIKFMRTVLLVNLKKAMSY